MKDTANWILIIAGGLAIVGEVALGAATGLDLALLGVSLVAGGALGLAFHSTQVGLFSAGAFAFIYLAFLRRRIKARMTGPNRPSNTDALLGKTALVTQRIAPHAPGMVRVGDDVWRAEIESLDAPAVEAGATVVVDSIEGVTLRVKQA